MPFWEKCTKRAQNLKPYMYKVKCTHTCVTSILEAQILLFRSTTSRFRVTDHLRKVHQITPKWPWTLQGQRYPINVTSVHESQISLRFVLNQPFSRYRPFWNMCTECDLEPCKIKLPYTWITGVHDSQISLRFTLRPALFEIQTILRQVPQMTPNWPWTLQRQITIYLYNSCPRVSNFIPFRYMASRFELSHLRHVHRMTSKWP